MSGAQQNQQGIHEPGTGIAEPELRDTHRGVEQAVQTQNQVQNQGETTQLQENVGAGQGVHEPGTGLAEPELKQVNQGTGQGAQNQSDRAMSRKSRVAEAVQAMERIATRNQGIGDQVRVIAQNQNRIQAEAEDALQTAQARNGFTRFLLGPNYKQLKTVEEKLANHTQNLAELKELRNQIQLVADKTTLDEQIAAMEEITAELENEILENEQGFSLFGWLSRFLAK